MDFYRIKERVTRSGTVEVYPDFKVVRSTDLMIRGRSFYAIWDEDRGLWSTDEYDVQRLVDQDLMRYREGMPAEADVHVKLLGDFSTSTWLQFRNYIGHLSDSSHQLDENLVFSNTDVKKNDYASRRLPYPLSPGDYSAWDELVGVLYSEDEKAKLEWAIGAIVSGDARHIQKFLVLYGAAGAGKSTILNIIQKLFEGYYTTFEAKALTSSSNAFSTEVFKSNPLVALQHDGDLSKIEDNTKLNSIISHEEMTMNEKYKPSYMARINAFLFMATNKPVKITDAKSGIIRRLIDVKPSGERVNPKHYQALMSQIDFQLGAIAHHCLEVYREMGKNYYNGYRPVEMMLQTDVFYNYIEAYYDIFKEQDGATLKQAYELYKQFCDETLVEYRVPQYRFREELKNYFANFEERAEVDGVRVRSWYSGFLTEHFKVKLEDDSVYSLVLDEKESIFDKLCQDRPAQYATINEIPISKWVDVDTTLADIDTNLLHYVKPPENHIVIDFDLKDTNGEKSAELNLEAASKWPPTYAEYSKGGGGIHLHYNYAGDATELGRVYDEGIEIKVFTGDSSLRRKLSWCNSIPVATLAGGLPLKEKKVINVEAVKSEKSLRDLIERNLRKEIHPGTKPSIDFIHKILEDAYSSDLKYDLTDMRGRVLAFANNSSNQAMYCIKLVQKMRFQSEEAETVAKEAEKDSAPLTFFDVEVFPNLFIVSWKYEGEGKKVVRMVNPKPAEIEELVKHKLVGYNVRRYDNHILYARMMGYNNEQLYILSQKIISNTPGATFGEAYELSYADIYDYSSVKQSLKKFQIELGLEHKELGLPWDQPVPEELWGKVGDYCDNDVITTEQVHNARRGDFTARKILSDISGLSVNSTTQKHTAKIIFGNDRDAQKKFVYTDLSEMFPGYEFDMGKSTYKGEEVGEGGYVYAEPGIYHEVALLDIASMHPTSIIQLNLFGPYTEKFQELVQARLAIKNGQYDDARKMLNGMLAPHLENEEDAEALSYALKIVINIVYGLTSAKFDNAFRDMRNKDNIVAKRGALFMIDLKNAVQEQGFTVAHIKTDSIKIPDATPEIIEFVMEFGSEYGYIFEHEATYEKMALVNDAVYVAKTKPGRKPAYWETVGAQFQQPYVKKTLFTKEPIEFKDLCEAKFVSTALYLDFTPEDDDTPMAMVDEHKHLHFVGKAGLFTPIVPGKGGALLMREKDGKLYAATGTKGYRWLESDMVEDQDRIEDVDHSYFMKLVNDAVANLSKYGDVEAFLD